MILYAHPQKYMLLKKVPKGSVVHIHQTRPDLILMKKKKFAEIDVLSISFFDPQPNCGLASPLFSANAF